MGRQFAGVASTNFKGKLIKSVFSVTSQALVCFGTLAFASARVPRQCPKQRFEMYEARPTLGRSVKQELHTCPFDRFGSIFY